MDLVKFKQECENAPRLKEMADFFSTTAAGIGGMPLLNECKVNNTLFQQDASVNLFYKVHENLRGQFDKHFFASIPYMLEEECRMGTALLSYGISKSIERDTYTKVYTLGTAEATMARTIAKLANGKIKTFSCSPTKENEQSFYSHGIPEHAKFFVGPFYKVDYSLFESNPKYYDFKDGFDVIVEDTTFQMYGKNRYEQIACVIDKLKDDGVFIFVEKFKNGSLDDYMRRESQKDKLFKSKYFSSDQIESKKLSVLSIMNNFEAHLTDFYGTLSKFFKNAVMTWNSGNFYIIMASNSQKSLKDLVSKLIPPCIPSAFCYESLPKIIMGLDDIEFGVPSVKSKIEFHEKVNI